jgi:hypothetical protein
MKDTKIIDLRGVRSGSLMLARASRRFFGPVVARRRLMPVMTALMKS